LTKLSDKVIKEVKKILPELREELLEELERWEDSDKFKVCSEFHSDKHVMAHLPYATYEYIILAWGLDAKRLDKDAAIDALNGKIFKDIRKITAHTLRRIAFCEHIKKLKL
jgi:hypothetical protein